MIDRFTIDSSLTRTVRRASGDVLGRLAARSARLLLRTSRVQQKAFALVMLLGFNGIAMAAISQDTPITNIASASYNIGTGPLVTIPSNTDTRNLTACVDVGLKVELMRYVKPKDIATVGMNVGSVNVQTTLYSPSGSLTGPFAALPTPIMLGVGAPATIPSLLTLIPFKDAAGRYIAPFAPNESIFLRVVAYGANKQASVADTVMVTITTTGGG